MPWLQDVDQDATPPEGDLGSILPCFLPDKERFFDFGTAKKAETVPEADLQVSEINWEPTDLRGHQRMLCRAHMLRHDFWADLVLDNRKRGRHPLAKEEFPLQSPDINRVLHCSRDIALLGWLHSSTLLTPIHSQQSHFLWHPKIHIQEDAQDLHYLPHEPALYSLPVQATSEHDKSRRGTDLALLRWGHETVRLKSVVESIIHKQLRVEGWDLHALDMVHFSIHLAVNPITSRNLSAE